MNGFYFMASRTGSELIRVKEDILEELLMLLLL